MKKTNTKKLSENTIKKLNKQAQILPIIHSVGNEEEKVDIVVTPYISAQDYVELISNISNACVFGGEYHPATADLAIKAHLFREFTNLKTTDIELIYDFVCHYPQLAEEIVSDIRGTYPKIEEDILNAIDYQKQKILKRTDLSRIADKAIEILDGLDKKFANISPEEVSKLIEIGTNLSNKNEKEIAEAVLGKKLRQEITEII